VKHEELNQELAWVREKRSVGLKISRKMIKEQALKTFKRADMEELSGDEDAKKSNEEGVVKVNVFAF
jgi:hypothetical protein